uniref:Nuclear receptor-binding factor 2 MIT domain-containing protein n=1 Tax=Spermophilus dauricus TaxID=99837 RepID=A0A8C9NYK4_SPEDA
MEVMEAPLNLAHQQSRRADHLLAAGKYEEAISCHKKAVAYLSDKKNKKRKNHIQGQFQMCFTIWLIGRSSIARMWETVTVKYIAYLIYPLELMVPTWQTVNSWRFTFSQCKPNGYLE